jgi:membrane protease YdiL (CAAX protease family)
MNMTQPPKAAEVSSVQFFLLTYVLSWLIWIPLTLSHFGIGPFHIPEATSNAVRLLGVLMPAVSASLLTARAGGRAATRNLFARLFLWRVSWKWWLAAVAVQPALLGLAALTINLTSNEAKVLPQAVVSAGAFIVNVIFLLIATLGEEIGWRGVALPALQQRNRPIKSSLILGLLWAAWHLPFWLLLDSFDQFGIGYLALNFLFVVPLTLYMTWFFNHSQQSILLPVMFHLSFNIVNAVLLPVTLSIGAFLIFGIFEWILVLALLRQMEPASVNRLQMDHQAS